MFIYNLNKNEWMIIKVPGAPPPRCGHQAITTAANKGELWIFGGEFSSPSESQFYHYKDLWVYRFAEKKWIKILYVIIFFKYFTIKYSYSFFLFIYFFFFKTSWWTIS